MDETVDKKAKAAEKTGPGRGVVRKNERNARQAQSLRDNLKKRKQQVRSRDDDDGQGNKPEA